MHYKVLTAFLISIMAGTAAAQRNKTEPVADPQPAARSEKKGKQPMSANFPIEGSSQLSAKLMSTLDAKSSKPGDKVELKALSSVISEGQVVVPKGSKLIGRITDVKRTSKGSNTSQIEMVIDRIANKDIVMPITAQIVAISSVAATANTALSSNDDLFPQSTARGTRSTRGGGLLGGVTQSVGSTVGGVAGTAGSVVGSATGSAGGVTNGLGNTVGGLQIATSASGSVNATSAISALGKNVRVEKGTTFDLMVSGSAY